MMSQKSQQFASVPLVGLESLEQDSESESSSPEELRLFEPAPSSIVGECSTDRRSDDDDNLLNRCLHILELHERNQDSCWEDYKEQQLMETEKIREVNRLMVGTLCLSVLMVGLLVAWYLVLA